MSAHLKEKKERLEKSLGEHKERLRQKDMQISALMDGFHSDLIGMGRDKYELEDEIGYIENELRNLP